MSEIIFTEEDYTRMEKESKRLLGWSLSDKTGMTIKDMIANPILAREKILEAKSKAGLIDRYKFGKLLSYLEDPNWKQILKEKLS